MLKEKLRKWGFLLRLVLGVAILILLVQHVDFNMLALLGAGQITIVILVVLAVVATAWFEAARLRSLSENQFTMKTMLRVIFIALFITNFTPASIGGDGYKILKMAGQKGYVSATALILLERTLGLSVLLLGSFVFAVLLGDGWLQDYYAIGSTVDFQQYWNEFTQTLLAGFLILGLLLLLFFRRFIFKLLREFVTALIQIPFKSFSLALLYTVMFHTVKAILLCIVLAVVGQQLDFAQAWVVLAFAAVAGMIPLSIGGLGIREAAFVVALAPFAIASPPALFAGLVFRIASIFQAGIGSFLSIRSGKETTEK
ncbi:MAG: uncharacterized membrane protein YbhN (UPF0104 family) [Halioglobus sp.]